jgi:hypothetical protein
LDKAAADFIAVLLFDGIGYWIRLQLILSLLLFDNIG